MDFNVAIKMIEILEKNGIKTPEELEKIFPSTKITDDYPTLATIKVGDSRDMRRVLEDKKTNIVRLAEDLMNQKAYKDSIETKEATVDLCSATVKELTGKDRAVLYQIIDAVINKGFGLCKPEDCLRLREAYYGGKTYIIAMDPICGSNGDPHIFFVDCDLCGLWLNANSGSLSREWDGNCWFVFRRRSAVKA
ncbi:MAG: hypothetical protein UT05_C0010G0028 [Parcubacteria group bacterium GW2011_GWF2_38_76]|nr:MAG: hypothetical protein UT05_C0010G0028 [Parcubacteria group bacterium GW2011_GWF2_38_76]HBM45541.1 hypothetical protein [Patescibacteria group bacterium]